MNVGRVRIGRNLIFALAAMSNTAMAQDPSSRSSTNPLTANDDVAIRGTLSAYNEALNGGKTDAVLPLYTSDGIFMAPYNPSAIGQAAVHKAYDAVFDELKFNVVFNIAEVVPMAPTWAYVRTNSAGTTLHHSSGKTTSEANQELFVMRKDEGHWKIARYSFSPTHSPAP